MTEVSGATLGGRGRVGKMSKIKKSKYVDIAWKTIL
jgi:hypothetical protein